MKKGFTLIELLVVIAIITILSSVVIAALTETTKPEKEKCQNKILYNSISDLPAICLKYIEKITNKNTENQTKFDCSQLPEESGQQMCRSSCREITNSEGRSQCLDACENASDISPKKQCEENNY